MRNICDTVVQCGAKNKFNSKTVHRVCELTGSETHKHTLPLTLPFHPPCHFRTGWWTEQLFKKRIYIFKLSDALSLDRFI